MQIDRWMTTDAVFENGGRLTDTQRFCLDRGRKSPFPITACLPHPLVCLNSDTAPSFEQREDQLDAGAACLTSEVHNPLATTYLTINLRLSQRSDVPFPWAIASIWRGRMGLSGIHQTWTGA
jgi:hypothetical protein